MTNQDKIKYSPEIEGYLASRYLAQTRSLADAIIKQVGGEKRFLEIYEDVVFNAQPRTVDGFKSTSNVINFFNNNKTDILAYIKESADSVEADDAAGVIHYRLYENTHTVEEVRAAIKEDSNKSSDVSRLHVALATFATMDAFSDFCDGFNLYGINDDVAEPSAVSSTKKISDQKISRLILATRNTNSNKISITSCLSNTTDDIHAHFKRFLEESLGMTDYAKQVIYGKEGEVVESYLVKFIDDDQYYTVHSFCDVDEDNDHDAGIAIEQLDINDLNKLIECLVMEGYLSPDIELLKDQGLELRTRPLVVLALVGASSSNQGILSIGTNDSLMISTKPQAYDQTTNINLDYSKRLNIINRMIEQQVFTGNPIPENVMPEHGSDTKIVKLNRSKSHPYKLEVQSISDSEVTNNSLLLAAEFTSVFESLTGRIFQKPYEPRPKCKSLADHVSAIHKAEQILRSAINNYLF